MPRLSKIGAAALAAFGWTSGAGGAAAVSATTLVVAGGGGGSGGAGSGGSGGGGLLYGTMSLNPTLSYAVVVGAGGAAAASSGIVGGLGGNSVFNNATAIGGGVGSTGGALGLDGGSGGGGGGATANGSNRNGTNATQTSSGGLTGYGNNGSNTYGTSDYAGGGGGGAGAVGGASTSNNGGNGGVGLAYSISGTSTYYAGGGAGGGTGSGGTGGLGGGGNGGNTSVNGTNGTANTGGGAGGQRLSNPGANGGSGIVIISYSGTQQFGGGVVTSVGGNTIHTFLTSGTLSPISSLSASYLIVAGGGGGGAVQGGGGGGGGLLSGTSMTIDTSSTYLVTVGAGGTAGATVSTNGTNGTNSTFSLVTTTALGGGGGGSGGSGPQAGSSGGSGGGGSYSGGTSSGTSGQGFGGGSGLGAGGYTAGGGGGAGAIGQNAVSTSQAGAGGIGVTSSISGTSTYYAGGGGGGAYASGGGAAGVGGLGGGADGANGLNVAPNNATPFTGGGGGGGGAGGSIGGNGGSGIVIISYAGATQLMAGGTVTITGGNVIHTFTSSGYLTPLTLVSNSLRTRSSASAYLSRTPTVAGNRQTWTFSAWVKRGKLGADQGVISTYTGTASINTQCSFTSNDTLDFYDYDGSGFSFRLVTTQVFRDPAAWYHIVLALDTTQATSSNRVKMYVNGAQITAFSTATYPSQNYALADWNNNSPQRICEVNGSYFDGYMAEVRNIDGQTLTPNSFGTFNSYGVWQPITYGGSYGTNGFYLPFTVDKTQYSYAFNTTPSYLTSSTAGLMPLGNTTWSIECWVWCNVVPTSNVAFIQNTASGGVQIFYKPSINTVEIGAYGVLDVLPATTTVNNLLLNAWNHFVFTSNGTQLRIFANGILIGYLSSSYSFAASQSTVYIGTNDTTAAQTLDGFISNLRVCNGSIPTTYQTSSTTIGASIFTPPTTALTTTSQGAANVSLLTCQSSTIIDNSSSPKTLSMTGTVTPSNIGCSSNPFYDRSPVGNNWTPNNISLINGSTCDLMTDVPTLTSATVANYCVWNPLNGGSYALANANLQTAGAGATSKAWAGTLAANSGKWYYEYQYVSSPATNGGGGVWDISSTYTANSIPDSGTGTRYVPQGGGAGNIFKFINGTSTLIGTYASYTTGDIIGVAFDCGAGTVSYYKNNTLQVTITDSNFVGKSLTPVIYTYTGDVAANFGQQPFTYTPPSGFVALNTYNI